MFYPIKSYKPNMISFGQLLMKDLGIDDHEKLIGSSKWRRPEVECAVLHTMVFEPGMLAPLVKCGIPITVFKDRDRSESGPLVEEDNASNMNLVHQNKWGQNFFGVFHSKLMLLEFDDRLRVVVSSSNLYRHDWELMSQVIWFQDFYPKAKGDKSKSEFESYLIAFTKDLLPKNYKRDVFRREINISRYDFAGAAVKLIGSVNGRFTGTELFKYG